VPDEDGTMDAAPVTPGHESAPGLIVYRFGAGIFYANTQRFAREVRELVEHAPHPVRCVIIDASGLSDVDYTAGYMLGELERRLGLRGIALVFAHMDERVKAQLFRYETLPIGPSGRTPFFDRVHQAVAAFTAGEIPIPESDEPDDP
jgi:SulP family sulfate permease